MYRAMRKAGSGWWWMALSCLLLAAYGSAASAQGKVDKSKWPARLTFAAGPVGGFGHTTGSPWASIVGTDVGVPVSIEATGGFSISLQMVDEGKADIAMTTTDLTYQGWHGADWSKNKKLNNQRTLMVFGANVLHIYTARKSGIKNLVDISGHSANPSRRRSGADLVFRDIMDTLGIKPARITNVNPSGCQLAARRRPPRRGRGVRHAAAPGGVGIRDQSRHGAARDDGRGAAEVFAESSVPEPV